MTLYMFLNYILTGTQFKYGKYILRLFREESGEIIDEAITIRYFLLDISW